MEIQFSFFFTKFLVIYIQNYSLSFSRDETHLNKTVNL